MLALCGRFKRNQTRRASTSLPSAILSGANDEAVEVEKLAMRVGMQPLDPGATNIRRGGDPQVGRLPVVLGDCSGTDRGVLYEALNAWNSTAYSQPAAIPAYPAMLRRNSSGLKSVPSPSMYALCSRRESTPTSMVSVTST